MSALPCLAAALAVNVTASVAQERPGAFARELVIVAGAPLQELAELAGEKSVCFYAATATETADRAQQSFVAGREALVLTPPVSAEELRLAARSIEPADAVLLAGEDALAWLELFEPRRHGSALLHEVERARSRGKRIFLGTGAASALAPAALVPATTFGPIRRNPREREETLALARGLAWLPFDLVELDAPGHAGLARAVWTAWTQGRDRTLVLSGDVLVFLDARMEHAEVRGPGAALVLEGGGSRREKEYWRGAHVLLLRSGESLDLERNAERSPSASPASGEAPGALELGVPSIVAALDGARADGTCVPLVWPGGSATLTKSAVDRARGALGPGGIRARLDCQGAPPRLGVD